MKCGDATKGNVELFYKGACKKEVEMKDAYRCTGCGGWFHLDCILKHFQEEEAHDNARNALKKIKDHCHNKQILEICEQGLKQNKPLKDHENFHS